MDFEDLMRTNLVAKSGIPLFQPVSSQVGFTVCHRFLLIAEMYHGLNELHTSINVLDLMKISQEKFHNYFVFMETPSL